MTCKDTLKFYGRCFLGCLKVSHFCLLYVLPSSWSYRRLKSRRSTIFCPSSRKFKSALLVKVGFSHKGRFNSQFSLSSRFCESLQVSKFTRQRVCGKEIHRLHFVLSLSVSKVLRPQGCVLSVLPLRVLLRMSTGFLIGPSLVYPFAHRCPRLFSSVQFPFRRYLRSCFSICRSFVTYSPEKQIALRYKLVYIMTYVVTYFTGFTLF